MSSAQEMTRTNPTPAPADAAALTECIEACFGCTQACSACADACLGEREHLETLTRCIRLNLDCADICDATGRLLSRQTEFPGELANALVETCSTAAHLCAEECERHAEGMSMEHCRVCAESCRRCEAACTRLLSALKD